MTMKIKAGKALLASAALALVAGAATLMASAQQPTSQDTIIHAGRVLAEPASGQVLTQQTILVRNGRIVSITAGYSRVPSGAKLVDLRQAFVLPGLIDSHVHLASEQGPDARLNGFLKTESDAAIDAAGFAVKTLNASWPCVPALRAASFPAPASSPPPAASASMAAMATPTACRRISSHISEALASAPAPTIAPAPHASASATAPTSSRSPPPAAFFRKLPQVSASNSPTTN
jgi:predicted amidohydrolase YtcJ